MANELATVNTAVAIISEDKLGTVQRLAKLLAASGYFSDVADIAQASVKIMAGEELGIGPVASLMGINIIKGKVALSANLIASQVRRHGYNYKHIKFDNSGCELEFLGKDGQRLGFSVFNEKDARDAGVFSDMYKKYPRNMYFARAISNGAKWFCPEVMSGLPAYVPEELGATVNKDGDIIDASAEPEVYDRAAYEQVKAEKAKAVADYAGAKAEKKPQPIDVHASFDCAAEEAQLELAQAESQLDPTDTPFETKDQPKGFGFRRSK